MRYPVYKALDKPNNFFGLKGCYIRYTAIIGIVAGIIGIFIGKATVEILGFIAFLGLLAIDYIAVLAFQSKYSEREKDRMMCSFSIPSFITVPPVRLSKQINKDTLCE